MTSPFRLYPEEQRWWSFADYQMVLDVMQARRPRRVLEFGPGSSTLALIEGGAERIDSCEDDLDWLGVYRDRLARPYPGTVRLRSYTWRFPLQIGGVDDQVYDLGLIDGPRETLRRPVVVAYALERCTELLVPVDGCAPLRAFLADLNQQPGLRATFTQTGPLAGEFAWVARC